MIASSQTISLQVLRTCPCPVSLEILPVALSDLAKSSGNLKAEWAVRPPASRVAAMPEEATATAMAFSFLGKANSKFSRKVLPVPPGASKIVLEFQLLSQDCSGPDLSGVLLFFSSGACAARVCSTAFDLTVFLPRLPLFSQRHDCSKI
ncbi:hypothetical protein TNCT_653801 [Trichonephila clavata]|uniref:Uncharacterized protein n=1 Tax=Trichonephila clavata TaxID=2740835 RepID=A0A8X6GN52_TRICU|nr:hypothetical protein TNCT_653801 [Trichonephila clavata]